MPRWRLVRAESGETVVAHLRVADRFWSRFLGLQFRRPLGPEAGLLLKPCRAVHTCFVRFPLDLFFLDKTGRVLAICRDLQPWRVFQGPPQSKAVLELTAGHCDLQTGEVVRVERCE